MASFTVTLEDGKSYRVDGVNSEAEAYRQVRNSLNRGTTSNATYAGSTLKGGVRGVTGTLDFAHTLNRYANPMNPRMGANVLGAIGRTTGFLDEDTRLPGEEAAANITQSAVDAGLTYGNLEELPRSHRPFAVAGEVVGGSIIPTTGSLGLLRSAGKASLAGKTVLPSFIKKSAETAAQRLPLAIGSEVAAISGSAQGAALAEAAFPSNDAARAGGEIAGAFFNPVGLLSMGYGWLTGKMAGTKAGAVLGRYRPTFTRAGAERQVARNLRALAKEMGEDPDKIAAELSKNIRDFVLDAGENPDDLSRLIEIAGEGVELTPALKAQSRALFHLEASLASQDPSVARSIDRVRELGLGALRETYESLLSTGDPKSIRVAARMRARYISDLLQARVDKAKDAVTAARQSLGSGGAAGKVRQGRSATEVIQQAWNDIVGADGRSGLRGAMWSQIPENVPVNEGAVPQVLIDGMEAARGRLAATQRLPKEIDDWFQMFGNKAGEAIPGTKRTVGKLTTGELRKFRHLVTSESARKPDKNTAAALQQIVNSIDEQFKALGIPEINDAIKFEIDMHNAFTRGFAGQFVGQEGAASRAGVSLQKAFGSGGEDAAIRFQQLKEAADLPTELAARISNPPKITPGLGDDLLASQEQFLRDQIGSKANRQIAAGILPEGTGQYRAGALRDTVADNPTLTGRFGGVKGDALRLADQEEFLARQAKYQTTRMKKAMNTLSRAIEYEDPERAINAVFAQKNPERGFRGLVNMARRSDNPKEALSGLRSAALGGAWDASMGNIDPVSGERFVSWVKLREVLTNPQKSGGKDAIGIMTSTGLLDQGTAKNLRLLLQRAARIELSGAAGNPAMVENLLPGMDAFSQTLVSIGGSAAGGALHTGIGGTGPGSIIAAGRGAGAARAIAGSLLQGKQHTILSEAISNPEMLARLMKMNVDRSVSIAQLRAFLIHIGVIGMQAQQEKSGELRPYQEAVGQ